MVSTVEVLDPMVLSSKVKEVCDCKECNLVQIPQGIVQIFDEELVLSGESRRLYVSLGQFSIVRLERDAQIVVPMAEYSIPTKECCDNPGGGEDPCEMFSRIPFPQTVLPPSIATSRKTTVPAIPQQTDKNKPGVIFITPGKFSTRLNYCLAHQP